MHSLHLGRDNNHLFRWKGKKFLINPLPKSTFVSTNDNAKKVLMNLFGLEFQRELKSSKDVILLMAKELYEQGLAIPNKLIPLLDDWVTYI